MKKNKSKSHPKKEKLKFHKGDIVEITLEAIVVCAENDWCQDAYYEMYLPDVGHEITIWKNKELKKKNVQKR